MWRYIKMMTWKDGLINRLSCKPFPESIYICEGRSFSPNTFCHIFVSFHFIFLVHEEWFYTPLVLCKLETDWCCSNGSTSFIKGTEPKIRWTVSFVAQHNFQYNLSHLQIRVTDLPSHVSWHFPPKERKTWEGEWVEGVAEASIGCEFAKAIKVIHGTQM